MPGLHVRKCTDAVDASVVPEVHEDDPAPRSWRKLSGVEFSQTRPISGARTLPFSTLIVSSFSSFFADQSGAVLHEFLIFGSEGGGEVAVYIQLANNLAMSKDPGPRSRTWFPREHAQIAGILTDIVDHDSAATRGSGGHRSPDSSECGYGGSSRPRTPPARAWEARPLARSCRNRPQLYFSMRSWSSRQSRCMSSLDDGALRASSITSLRSSSSREVTDMKTNLNSGSGIGECGCGQRQ